MDGEEFDRLTRAVSRAASRRGLLRSLGAALTAVVAATVTHEAAFGSAQSVPLGGACYSARQCFNEYLSTRHRQINPRLQTVYCAENGFTYDGVSNCCRNTGGACYADEHCCGILRCAKRLCTHAKQRRRGRRRHARGLHPHRSHRRG